MINTFYKDHLKKFIEMLLLIVFTPLTAKPKTKSTTKPLNVSKKKSRLTSQSFYQINKKSLDLYFLGYSDFAHVE